MPRSEVFAPAKINLALHVTGRRSDGYHLLDSLVAFAPFGDRLTLAPDDGLWLRVTGPEAAGVPEDARNLVMRAVALMGPGTGARITLEKHLPAASGIGGGSSDAAAALRGMAAQRGDPALPAGLERLGADVPMCLDPRPARSRGIGEELTPVTLPPLPAVLVNPRVEVATPAVFKALACRENPPLPEIPRFATVRDCARWLAAQRNDLEMPAMGIAPQIAEVLAALGATEGCLLSRMSGSGATCFALYESEAAAAEAQAEIAAARPDWWSASGTLGDQSALARPRQA